VQAVILCGGLGTRLRPVTESVPKALVEVGGRPFLEIQLEQLRRGGISESVLLTGYLGEMIEEYFGPGAEGLPRLKYSREETPLGTGGALRKAAALLGREFFLVNGDTFLPADYRDLLRSLRKFAGVGILSVYPSAGTSRTPNLRLGEEGRIAGYDRAGDPHAGYAFVDAGVAVFRKKLLDFFPEGEVFSLEQDVYPLLAAGGLLGSAVSGQDFYDIGTPERLERFQNFLVRTKISAD